MRSGFSLPATIFWEWEMIGLSRNLKLSWLNEAARLRQENLSAVECKARLTEFLSAEIESPTNLRKTREILMRVWIYDGAEINSLRTAGAAWLEENPNAAQAIHWSLLLVAYPIFAELNKIIGRLFEMGEVVTLRQIKQKLFDELGERSTLYHSTDKIISTLKNFGVISARRPGEFFLTPQIISDKKIIALLIRAAMTIDGGSYCKLSELERLTVLYPFKFAVSGDLFADEEIFTVASFGGEAAVVLK